VHAKVGVLAAVTVATAAHLGKWPAALLVQVAVAGRYKLEHPTGSMLVSSMLMIGESSTGLAT